jgi:hypothetical protein
MSPRTVRSILLLLAGFAVVAAACSGGQPIDTGGGGPDSSPYTPGSLGNDALLAMVDEGCGVGSSCHTVAGELGAGDLLLPDSNGTLTSGAAFAEITGQVPSIIVTGSNAATSVLLMKGNGQPGHVGGNLWAPGDASYQAVLLWLQAGAPTN